ncbi:type I polyketide synthase [Mycobacterium sp. 1423905.2]|uniref:type I polyketide synthase n=1 Tax=Mycobacterium sp. 1423905.2 TaxID=1856859 RepID=UPI0007FF1E18|nr:type I polyketide synthase [Mycobacterium sp. 1423905.2]OBJ48731.1 polyketide synthase [Mycobacterium sp. 1423905.2]
MSADVAIIGLACRFPGASSPREFWRLLRDAREATPPALDNVAEFDASFFNISPREASAMDPRQRLTLELTWELLEDAFIVPTTLRGQHIAVYVGAMNDDYAFLTTATGQVDHHSFTGINRGMIANRVSYAYEFHGPSVSVDTGQSSALVAVHLACETLRSGASPLAIAGGVHLNLASETVPLETEFGAVSKSGHTYAFDGRADGYVRSEGAGLVLLKPLAAAVADGDTIRAVIRGSAVGNAGHSAAGLTVPSVSGQVDVIRCALANAQLDPDQIDYVEAHGTGTEVGDPIEATALGEVFAGRRDNPVALGSVKTNIGHTGAAAGIAGLLKVVLALENAELPATLNHSAGSAAIDLPGLGLRVNTALTPWSVPPNRPRRAGVSSFGMGGTNAHLVVEQGPDTAKSVVRKPDTTIALVLSARSAEALANQASRLSACLGDRTDLDAVDVAWSLVSTRAVFEHRAVVVGSDRPALLAGLAQPAVAGRVGWLGKTVFVFPGQGSQWLGLGQPLYERFPAFANAFDEAASALDEHLRLPLRQVLWGADPGLLHSTEFAQPALFAVEVALAALLQACGVTADLVAGHSVGEIAAAYVAGVLSLPDAARLVALRGQFMAALSARGAMVAVAASEEEVAPLLIDGVDIAAFNGPDSVVISGPEEAVGAVAERLLEHGRQVRRLAVSHAFHSALMEPMLTQFARALADLPARDPRIELIANVTGQLADSGYGSAQYWVDHVRRPVRFADTVATAQTMGAGVFIEVGPAAGLTAAVEQSLSNDRVLTVAALPPDRSESDSVLTALGRLYCAGANVDWRPMFDGLSPARVEVPTYGFARQRYWLGGGEDLLVDSTRKDPETIDRLRRLSPTEQRRELVELVCSHAAAVLGHPSGHDIDSARPFQDLGFTSLTGVELRDRLKKVTGLTELPLSRTLIFDYPTPDDLAAHLAEQLSQNRYSDPSDDESIWTRLRAIPLAELRSSGLLDKLLSLAGSPGKSSWDTNFSDDAIDSLGPDALIALALEKGDRENRS